MPVLLAEGTTTTIDTIVTAVQGMAASVQSGALNAIDGILPVVAPITAAIIVANLGRRLVIRFAK
jgi:hypothetical protein